MPLKVSYMEFEIRGMMKIKNRQLGEVRVYLFLALIVWVGLVVHSVLSTEF